MNDFKMVLEKTCGKNFSDISYSIRRTLTTGMMKRIMQREVLCTHSAMFLSNISASKANQLFSK